MLSLLLCALVPISLDLSPDPVGFDSLAWSTLPPGAHNNLRGHAMRRSQLLAVGMTAASVLSCYDDDFTGPRRLDVPTASVTSFDTLVSNRDTYIAQTDPHKPRGTRDSLVIEPVNRNRVLVGFDQATIVSQVGSDSLVSATLQVTIKSTNSGWGGSGSLSVYRLTSNWTEAAATWACAIDANTSNNVADCSGPTIWSMTSPTSPPWFATLTASVPITNGMTGVLNIPVTADVRAFLSGTGNNGWLLKGTTEGSGTARISFRSREFASGKPRLILVTESVMPHNPTRPPIPDSTVWPASPLTVVSTDSPEFAYFQTVYFVQFDDSTSGLGVTAFLNTFGGTIVGGLASRDGYYISTASPGTTFASVKARADSMRNYPNVGQAGAVSYKARGGIRGRYPLDGLGTARSDWLTTTTNQTKPWLQVNAPQSWSCENSKYGADTAVVGIVDWFFDLRHTDLDRPTTDTTYADLNKLVLSSWTISADERDHGNAVAGIMSATGHNSVGIAGMLWGGRLRQFPMMHHTGGNFALAPIDDVDVFVDLLRKAAASGVRALNISIFTGDANNPGDVSRLRNAVKDFVGPGPDRILVYAVAHQPSGGVSRTIAGMASGAETGISGLDRAIADLYKNDAIAKSGLVIVTGVTASGAKAPDADIWDVDTSFAAPYTVTTLAPTSGLSSVASFSGTSYSAPFLTGLAGQLWTMMPSLTAKEVKKYMYAGAKQVRPQSNGSYVASSSVSGASGTTFLIDAYGSLNLLSREKQGAPLCGVDVMGGTTSLVTDRLVFKRQAPDSLTLSTTSSFYWGTFSIAQGGRRLVVDAMDNTSGQMSSRYYKLQSGAWSPDGSTAGTVQTIFTELDTVYLRDSIETFGTFPNFSNRNYLFLRVGSSDPTHVISPEIHVSAGLPTPRQYAGWRSGANPVSPDGGWLYFSWFYQGSNQQCGNGSQDGIYESYVMPLRGQQGGNYSLQSHQLEVWCGFPNPIPTRPPFQDDEVVWRPNADQFLLVTHIGTGADSNSTKYQMYNLVANAIATTGASTTVTDVMTGPVMFFPYGTGIRGFERKDLAGATPCYLRTRVIGSLATAYNQSSLPADCMPQYRMGAAARPIVSASRSK